MSSHTGSAIAIIGAGPRGTSLLERIGAGLRETGRPGVPRDGSEDHGGVEADHRGSVEAELLDLTIHVVDDAPDGAGRVWRTDQTRELCMNTLAHAVTLFTEPSSSVEGPVIEGPTLYEWCVLVLHAERPSAETAAVREQMPDEHVAAFKAHPIRRGLARDYRQELEGAVPEAHPSRALYGEYLTWCYRRAVAMLPAGVRVVRHRSRAVGIEHTDQCARREHDALPSRRPRELVSLSDGSRLEADAVILATGWMPRTSTPPELALERAVAERPGLTLVRPDSPVDQDLSGVAPGERAIIRGLGMGFFDTMALLTVGRGGEFVRDPAASCGLRYLPSGREPIMHVTSNRGVPFRAKTLYHSLPPKPAQRFVRQVDWAKQGRPIDFNHLFWPRVIADAYLDHAIALHRVRPEAFVDAAADTPGRVRGALAAVLVQLTSDGPGRADDDFLTTAARIADVVAPFIPDPADRFDLLGEMRPVHRDFASAAAFDAWVYERTSEDLREAELGRESAVKTGLWSISAARGSAVAVGTQGGFDADSRSTGYRALMSLGAMVGSGPPAFRNRQLLALVDAGLVHFIGPRAQVNVGDEGFTAASPSVAGSAVTASALIEAWMRPHDLSETEDPLARSLVTAGRARPFRITTRGGDEVPTAAFGIDPSSGRLIDEHGDVDPSVHVVGIPADEQLHGTVISPIPGTDPLLLRETDRAARSALRIATAQAGSPGVELPHLDRRRAEALRV